MHTRLHALLLSLALAVALAPTALAEAGSLSFAAPGEHQVVGLGERVAYTLQASGVDCAETTVRTLVTAGDRVHEGEPTTGCEGAVAIPWEADLLDAGQGPIFDWEVDEISLMASAGDVTASATLLNKRYPARNAEVVLGDADLQRSNDPLFGGDSLAVAGNLTTLALGTVDLTGVSSLSFRYATPADGTDLDLFGAYRSAGRAFVTSDSPDGALVAAVDLRPSDDGEFTRVVEPVLLNPETPAELYVTFVKNNPTQAAPLLELSYLELNGSGAALPHELGPDPAGTVALYDGSGLDGWETAGYGTLPGRQEWYEEDDGSLRSGEGLVGLLWYSAEEFSDYTLRLEFKVDKHTDNSGVFVRFPAEGARSADWEDSYGGYEVQIDDFGQQYWGSAPQSQTGAFYDLAAPDRVNTRSYGEWNTYEITAVGQDYTVTLNGRTVTRYTGDRGRSGHIGLQVHDPASTVWFRDIRVIPHETAS